MSAFAGLFGQAFNEMWDRIYGLEKKTENEPIGYDIIETVHKFPGEYVYYGTFVVSFGEGVSVDGRRPQLTRLWANGEEIYNTFSGNIKPGLTFDYFDGSEDQGPVYRDMNYRGLICVVFRDMNLTDYGNGVPAITAEFYDAETSVVNTSQRKSFAYDGERGLSMQLSVGLNRVHRASFTDLTRLSSNPTGLVPLVTVDTATGSPTLKTGAFGMSTVNTLEVVFVPEIAFAVAQYDPTIIANGFIGTFAEWAAVNSAVTATFPITYGANENNASAFAVARAMARTKLTRNGLTKHYVVTINQRNAGYPVCYGILEVTAAGRLLWAGHNNGGFTDPTVAGWRMCCVTPGRVSEGETIVYISTPAEIGRITMTPLAGSSSYPGAVNHSVITNLFVAPAGQKINQTFYDVTNNRVIAILIKADDVTAYAVALSDGGATAWTSADFPRPSPKLGTISSEGSSDLSKGTLVLTRQEGSTVLTKIDTNTGDVVDVVAAGATFPVNSISIWDSRTNRLWLADYSFVDVGSNVTTVDGSTPDFAGAATAAEVMRAYADHVGFDDADVFTVNIDHMPIYGYVVSNSDDLGALARTIGGLYGFNWFTSGDQVTFKSVYDEDGELVIDLELTEDDLAVITNNSPEALNLVRGNDQSAPAKSSFTYFDIDNEYKAGNVKATRGQEPLPTHASTAYLDFTVPITMAAEQAQELLYGMLARSWAGKVAHNIRIPANGLLVNPVDVIKFEINGYSYTGVVTQPRVNADFSTSIALTETIGAVHPVKVEVQPPRVVPSSGTPARVILFEVPDLSQTAEVAEYFNVVAVAGAFDRDQFAGAILEGINTDDPSDVSPLLAFDSTEQGYVGSVIAAPGPWDRFDILDTLNTITIHADNIPAGKFVTATEAEMINGANTVIIGSATNCEILCFGNFEALGDNNYRLYNLLRGRYGTNTMGQTMEPNGNFAFFEAFKVFQYPDEIALQERELRYRARGSKQSPWQVSTSRMRPVGNSRKPYSPVDLYAEDIGGEYTIKWTRRARFYNNPPTDFVPVPTLDEASSVWRLSIYPDDTFETPVRVVDNIEIFGSTEWIYTTSLIAEDGIVIDDRLYIKLEQYSPERDLYGFPAIEQVGIIEPNSVRMSARIGAGGEVYGAAEIVEIPPVVGTIDGGGSMGAHIEAVTHSLAGAVDGGGALSGRIEAGYPFTGTIDGGGALAGVIVSPWTLAGEIAAGGTLTASLAITREIAGGVAGGGEVVANLTNVSAATGVALYGLTADMSTTTATTVLAVVLDDTVMATGAWSAPNGSGEVIVPAGVTFIDIEASVAITAAVALTGLSVQVRINGTPVATNTTRNNSSGGFTSNMLTVHRRDIPVTAGDVITLNWQKISATALGPLKDNTYLSVKAVG
jgi:hypothetical protein